MSVAVIADIHGNLPALRAVIEEIRASRAGQIICCGDIASGPMPAETLEYIRELDLPFRSIRGNADRHAVAAFDGATDAGDLHEDDVWTGSQLTGAMRDYLAELPATLTLDLPGVGKALFCHGTPRDDEEPLLATTAEARLARMLADVDSNLVVCGHTHMQFDRTLDRWRVVNPGSVGSPFDEPGAYWMLIDGGVAMHRARYDAKAAAHEIRRHSTWPRRERFIDRSLFNPPTRDEALAAMREVESRFSA